MDEGSLQARATKTKIRLRSKRGEDGWERDIVYESRAAKVLHMRRGRGFVVAFHVRVRHGIVHPSDTDASIKLVIFEFS